MQLAVPANAKRIRFSWGLKERAAKIEMDHPVLPPFSDDIALLILARLPSSKYCDLRLVSRRFRSLIRSGELNAIRKKIGFKEPKIFFDSGEARCLCYEPYTRSCWDLPVCPYDETTPYRGKELFCVGTHLLVLGIISGDGGPWSDSDIWTYELGSNRWFNGPMIITPRLFFASADCGRVACVAGGQQQGSRKALNSAEKYNPESKSWESLPSMNRRRCFSSGFYMDSKFYVIGGMDENSDLLTCGECYDFDWNVWELIPNMIEHYPSRTFNSPRSPYEVVVVNNELYYLHVPSGHLKVYLKNNNTWKIVGRAPASIEPFEGSDVKLKSLGDELVLFCRTFYRTLRKRRTLEIIMCFCTPSPELDNVEWRVLDFPRQGRNLAVYNCCVMMA